MDKFNEIFEELAKTNDRSVIWNDWLDYVVQINLINPSKKSPHNYHGNEKGYYNLLETYLNKLNEILQTEPYYDLLGELYEEVVLSQGKSKQLGQYYSPTCVAEITTDLTMLNQEFTDSDKIANDCACGSGRMLLASHVKSKGDMFCIGQDLDETSVKMCTLNFWSHGVRGSVLQMDSLEEKFFQGWRINKYLYHGIPVPHIEEIHDVSEAFNFFELKNKDSEKAKEIIEDHDSNSSCNEINTYASKGTGQTTLM